jgi:hypothetical protein
MMINRPPAIQVEHPKGYVCHRVNGSITVDGKLDDAAWQSALWSDAFQDIEGEKKPFPRYHTRMKILWDEKYLYIGAELEEPHVWGTLKDHDSIIFIDNDFEVFLDPDGDGFNYGELELNALNTTWDLFLPRPYRSGGPALHDWEIPGLKTAVFIDGTLNDPRDRDRGWSVEIAWPMRNIKEFSGSPIPPREGDQWRINFSRVEWEHLIEGDRYVKKPQLSEANWVWSPQGAIDMHRPEKWGYLQFTSQPTGSVEFKPDPSYPAREALSRIWYAQSAFKKSHRRFARTLEELNLKLHHPSFNHLWLEPTLNDFTASVIVPGSAGSRTQFLMNSDSRVRTDPPSEVTK